MKKLIAFVITVAATAVLCSCLSMQQSTKDRIDDVLAYIPTPSPTPAPPTPTPVPTPTPRPPDLSIARCLREVPGFAERNSLPVVSTGRGNMLDLRGHTEAERIHGDWCAEFEGASMPAITDAETNGVFLRCK